MLREILDVFPGAVIGLAGALGVAHCVADRARERSEADAGRVVIPLDASDDCARACANLVAKGCTVTSTCVIVCRRLDVSSREQRGVQWDPACIANAADRDSLHVCTNLPICERPQ